MSVEPGIYRHFKGAHYEVLGVGKHTETGDELVFYRALYGEYGFWVRPVADFIEEVERGSYAGARFVKIA